MIDAVLKLKTHYMLCGLALSLILSGQTTQSDFQNSIGFADIKDLFSWIITEGKQLDLFAITAWSVWNQRNRDQVQASSIDLHQVAAAARTSLDDFHRSRWAGVSEVTGCSNISKPLASSSNGCG